MFVIGSIVLHSVDIIDLVRYQEQKSSGKDGAVLVSEKDANLEESGTVDAVLVNTHQVYLPIAFEI